MDTLKSLLKQVVDLRIQMSSAFADPDRETALVKDSAVLSFGQLKRPMRSCSKALDQLAAVIQSHSTTTDPISQQGRQFAVTASDLLHSLLRATNEPDYAAQSLERFDAEIKMLEENINLLLTSIESVKADGDKKRREHRKRKPKEQNEMTDVHDFSPSSSPGSSSCDFG